ncbi:MAG TPA: gamma-glutamyltransferase [Xanthobacteraceae bacterium]|jgi:gamma-glutamyltranspeptidase/glutathione hydrolase
MKPLLRAVTLIAFLAFAGAAADAQAPAVATAKSGMVASEEARATKIGVDILRQGGNAVDAAVAVGFALAVTLPESGNLGGGGFMLIRLADRNQVAAIDYRETAPASAARGMFLDEKGEPDPQRSRFSGLAVGVPGTVAGLAYAHQKYGSGKLTLAQLIAPAIPLARDGFEIDARLAASLARAQKLLARHAASAEIFLRPDGSAPAAGEKLVQHDLANTLQIIALRGPGAFYEGLSAQQIALAVQAAGGRMSYRDLAAYRVQEREPVRGSYRGYEIFSMPPPSSGGAHLVQMLNILEGYDLRALGAGSTETAHHLIEAMKLAYADRAEFLGDPDFVKVPVKGLVSKRYAEELRKAIAGEGARPAAEIRPGTPAMHESDHTTHFSVVDKDGNAVANTYTLNFFFGVGAVAEATGVLLNNELDDFAAALNTPNAYGLIGGDANAPAPHKRPLSSMTPTIAVRDGKPYLVTGAAGGSRIITAVLQTIVNAVDFGMDAGAAVAAPRVHHQWLPDEVSAEAGVAPEVVDALKQRRHTVVQGGAGRSANTIMATTDGWAGVADPRSGGLAEGY